MFVANLAPIIIITGASGLGKDTVAMLLQNAMFVAGVATLIQLYPLWRIGARLPIVMGVSFTFVSILCYVGATYGYGTAMGAVLVGGIFEGGCKVAGIGIAIEKSFQKGARRLAEAGYRVESLARIKSLADCQIAFVD